MSPADSLRGQEICQKRAAVGHRGRSIKRWIGWSGLFITASVALAYLLVPAYQTQFEKPTMIGLTKEQVIKRVGEPTSIVPNEEVWSYQLGMDPDVTIAFTDGKVVEVKVFRR